MAVIESEDLKQKLRIWRQYVAASEEKPLDTKVALLRARAFGAFTDAHDQWYREKNKKQEQVFIDEYSGKED